MELNENNQEMVRKNDNGETNEAEASTCGNSLQESVGNKKTKLTILMVLIHLLITLTRFKVLIA